MGLMELYQTDETARAAIERIILSRSRMRYKRDALREALRGVTIQMREVYEMHWHLNPDDPPRVLKSNLTARRVQRPKKDRTK